VAVASASAIPAARTAKYAKMGHVSAAPAWHHAPTGLQGTTGIASADAPAMQHVMTVIHAPVTNARKGNANTTTSLINLLVTMELSAQWETSAYRASALGVRP
jgi:hypothetical protein